MALVLMCVGVLYLWFTLLSSLLSHSSLKQQQQLPMVKGVSRSPTINRSEKYARTSENTHASPTFNNAQSTQKLRDGKNTSPVSDESEKLATPTSATQKAQASTSTSIVEQAQSALKLLDSKNISPVSDDPKKLSKYISATEKECLPGRDDSQGEINHNTNRNRECLRFVQKSSKPRVGIMITPGYITNSIGYWIKTALKLVGGTSGNDVEVLITPHVPVYGYGKSHGFSKLIRVALPMPLAIIDAFVYEKLRGYSEGGVTVYIKASMLQRQVMNHSFSPTKSELETILKLLMRWHCRLSHVSAHTSMLSVSLNAILKDPISTMQQILQFVFTNNWEWEDKKGAAWEEIDSKKEAEELVSNSLDDVIGLADIIEETVVLQEQVEQLLSTSGDNIISRSLQNAFDEEMQLSEDMTHWPCPSFWDGVEKLKINSGLVPDCRDDHPWIKCTINRDKCEVKQDPECK